MDSGCLKVTVLAGRNLIAADAPTGSSDPFVELRKESSSKKDSQRTKICKKTLNPEWNETFSFDIVNPTMDRILFTVWDYDRMKLNDWLGWLPLPVATVSKDDKSVIREWYPLLDKNVVTREQNKTDRGDLHLQLEWKPSNLCSQKTRAKVEAEVQKGKPQKGVWETSWEIAFSELEFGPKLGEGAFGVVHRGKWHLQDVAIKQLHNWQNMTKKDVEEWRHEVGVMMQMRPHPNVLQLLGVCCEPEKPLCIITEFLEWGSLHNLLHGPGTMSDWSITLNIIKGIVAGMYHLHCENILHRDLASRNVLLRSNIVPIISDFGLSQKAKVDLKAGACIEEQIRGAYKWMPPESLQHNLFSIKSDVYSFGVTLWEILTRSDPFPELDIYQAAEKVIHEDLRPPTNQYMPPKFVKIMELCWQKDSEKRPDFKEIGRLLDEIEAEVHTY